MARHVVAGVFLSILAVGVTAFFLVFPHARERLQILSTIQSEDILGSDYQIRQNLISLGIWWMVWVWLWTRNTKISYIYQNRLETLFLLQLGEELGFFGSIIVIFFALFINLRILYTSYFIKDFFAKSVYSLGLLSLYLAQTFLNIGSVSGAIPLTGVPLPFISHGSTALHLYTRHARYLYSDCR
jgi:cell division protein FtsW